RAIQKGQQAPLMDQPLGVPRSEDLVGRLVVPLAVGRKTRRQSPGSGKAPSHLAQLVDQLGRRLAGADRAAEGAQRGAVGRHRMSSSTKKSTCSRKWRGSGPTLRAALASAIEMRTAGRRTHPSRSNSVMAV